MNHRDRMIRLKEIALAKLSSEGYYSANDWLWKHDRPYLEMEHKAQVSVPLENHARDFIDGKLTKEHDGYLVCQLFYNPQTKRLANLYLPETVNTITRPHIDYASSIFYLDC